MPEVEGDGAAFAGTQGNAVEVLEGHVRCLDTACDIADVELRHFLTVPVAGVGDGEGNPCQDILAGSRFHRSTYQVGIGKCGVALAISEAVERSCGRVDVVVAGVLAVVNGNLSHVAGNADGDAACRIVVAEEHIGDGHAALSAGIPRREQGIGLFGSKVHVEGAAFDVYDHEFHACVDEGLHQPFLVAHQLQAGAVVAFAAVHVAELALAYQCSTGGEVFRLEVAGTGTSYHQYGHLAALGGGHGSGDVGGSGVADGTSFDVFHFSGGEHCSYAVEDGSDGGPVLRSRIVAQLVVHHVGIRADDRHVTEVLAQGQRTVVLKQADTLAGHFACQLLVLLAADNACGTFGIDVRVLEEPEVELQGEDLRHGAVKVGLAGLSGLDGMAEILVAVAFEVDVHTGIHGQCTGLFPVFRAVVGLCHTLDALQVGINSTLEAPGVTQDFGQQVAVAGTGDTVNHVVRGHDAAHSGFYGALELRYVFAQQRAFAHACHLSVQTALGDSVGSKVLEGGIDVLAIVCHFTVQVEVALHAAHHFRGEDAGQCGVFAEGFLHAAPTRFACDVDDRSVAYVSALRTDFGSHGLAHAEQHVAKVAA